MSTKHRFAPGRSGNPKGRPTGRQNDKKILEKVALEKHSVVEKGQKQTKTTFTLLLEVVRGKALEGNVEAISYLEQLTHKINTSSDGDAAHSSFHLVMPDNTLVATCTYINPECRQRVLQKLKSGNPDR